MTSVVVDGVEYAPAAEAQPRLGVGITTRNRREVFAETHRRICELTPGAKVVVVDDASDDPAPEATFRFEKQAGIARAKNKCLELLDGCEHVFLFDDDCYPLVEGWWRPYVESPEPHLMFTFGDLAGKQKINDNTCIYRDSQHVAWAHARGCMLYARRQVLDAVGGMDPGFGVAMWEHADWSNRIHAAGLTSWRYADVVGSERLIYSLDEHGKVERSLSKQVRDEHYDRNRARLDAQRDEPLYREWREQHDVVITCLFTGQVDAQRGRRLASDPALLKPLLGSLGGHRVVVLHDGLDVADTDHVTYVRVEAPTSPYKERWLRPWQWLRDHPEVRRAWCVDATDVELLHDPFPHMRDGTLYIGSEAKTVAIDWLREHHPERATQALIAEQPRRQLLNCGVVGADRSTLLAFLHDIVKAHGDNAIDVFHGTDEPIGTTEMGVINALGWGRWADRIEIGPHINTLFKQNERNPWSWWKHK